MYVKFGTTPIQVDIWLKNGEKLSSVNYAKNPDCVDPIRLCEKLIEDLASIFQKDGKIRSVNFGSLIVNAEDISAIRYLPYQGK